MSAIYGKINFGQKPIDPQQLDVMRTVLNHWQGDDNGNGVAIALGLGI